MSFTEVDTKVLKDFLSIAKASRKVGEEEGGNGGGFFVQVDTYYGAGETVLFFSGPGIRTSINVPSEQDVTLSVSFSLDYLAKAVDSIPASVKVVRFYDSGSVVAGKEILSHEDSDDDHVFFPSLDEEDGRQNHESFPPLPFDHFLDGVSRSMWFRGSPKMKSYSGFLLAGLVFRHDSQKKCSPSIVSTCLSDFSRVLFKGVSGSKDFENKGIGFMMGGSGAEALHGVLGLVRRMKLGTGKVKVEWDCGSQRVAITGDSFRVYSTGKRNDLPVDHFLALLTNRHESQVHMTLDRKELREVADTLFRFARDGSLGYKIHRQEHKEPYVLIESSLNEGNVTTLRPVRSKVETMKNDHPNNGAREDSIKAVLDVTGDGPLKSTPWAQKAVEEEKTVFPPVMSSVSVKRMCDAMSGKQVELLARYTESRTKSNIHHGLGFRCECLAAIEQAKGLTHTMISSTGG